MQSKQRQKIIKTFLLHENHPKKQCATERIFNKITNMSWRLIVPQDAIIEILGPVNKERVLEWIT